MEIYERKGIRYDGDSYVRQWFPCGILRYLPIQISMWLKCGKWENILVDVTDEKLREWQKLDGDVVIPIEISSVLKVKKVHVRSESGLGDELS